MKRYYIPLLILMICCAFAGAMRIINQPPNGVAELTPTGARYTPNPSYHGADAFVFGLDDRCLPVPLDVKQLISISGTFRDAQGNPMPIPDGLVMQMRGDVGGRPYNYDAVYMNGQIALIRPVAPTTAHEIVGYPPELIEGW